MFEQFPPNLSCKEKSSIIRKSAPFTWIRGSIFKLDMDKILSRCVREEEVFKILLAYHDGLCGGHFAAKRTTFKVLKAGYYWLTLHQDVRRYPRELVTNQGYQFTSHMIENLLSQHKVKHRTSTPYHRQANGKVEVTNRALEGILTKVISNIRKDWANRLVEANWAYNTTWKTITSFTPYELVYGKKYLLCIEFEYNTLRMVVQLDLDITRAQQKRFLQLNGLDEFRVRTLLHIEVTQVQRKIWHDKSIKHKQFQEGDWALQYDSR
eukprot:PITA_03522